MSIYKNWRDHKRQKQRKFQHPGLINDFLDDPNRKTLPINLYTREIPRLERQFSKIAIRKDKRLTDTDLWACTVFKR